MFRFAASPAILLFAALIALSACSKNQPNMGLNASKLGATGADGQDGPAARGSMQEFASRIGDTVYFTTDSVILSQEAQNTLVEQARWLNGYSGYSIVLEGHADERGTREYNIALGAQRAASVKHFLTTRGVDPRRIRTISYGKERPVAVCANISCWSQNRRAVTVLSQNRAVARN